MDKLVEWLNMGGYALYVWGSFGATALLMIAEPIALRNRRRQILRRTARIARMNQEEQP
jgi:heme exporter protein D